MTFAINTEAAPTQPLRTPFAQTQKDSLPFYFYIALLSMVVPMSFFIGSLYMTMSRVTLLFIVPVLLIGLLNGKYGALTRVDKLFGLFLLWYGVAVVHHGSSNMVTFIGSNYIIMLGGYLLGRCCVRGPRAFRQMIIFYGLLVLISLPFAIYEMRTSIMPLARFVDQIPGVTGSPDVEYPSRNDLERVQFVFVHPIHYGLFCTYIFALVATGLRGTWPFPIRWAWGLAIVFCCFTSGSSGPFLGIMIAMVLMLYDVVSKGRWKLFLWGFGIVYFFLEIFSDRPAYFVIIERLAFNPGTAYGRRLILEVGIEQIQRTPIFGTPHALPLPHWMTGSLDNHWLLIAVAHGMPAFIFLVWAYLHAIIKASKADLVDDPEKAALRKAWIIGLVGSSFSLATVAIWSELTSLTYLMFGSGLWFMSAQSANSTPQETTQAAETSTKSKRHVYTRFPVETRPGDLGNPRENASQSSGRAIQAVLKEGIHTPAGRASERRPSSPP